MRRAALILAAILSLFPVQVYAMSTRTADYLAGEVDNAGEPFLVSTTAYTQGHTCCKGVKAREGIVAGRPEWYGMGCIIYEAIPCEGSYQIGDVIGYYEILDTGYGKSTKNGVPSKVRQDKGHQGTIEIGQCIDKYSVSMAAAVDWMEKTGGRCFIQLVSGKG